jgi:hypothetical protein
MSDDSGTTFSSFVHPDADGLLQKVDFAGMVGTFWRSFVIAIVSGVVAIPIAVGDAITDWFDALIRTQFNITTALASMPGDQLVAATTEAVASLGQFGFLAFPMAVIGLLALYLVVNTFIRVREGVLL